VFAANDQMALGLVRAFNEAGLEVPRDVSVAGFDDVPEAEYFWPPLTTVHQDFIELGRRSIDLLINAIGRPAGEPSAAAVPAAGVPAAVEPRLVVRNSVGSVAPPTCPKAK
jgi:DNA-binding LacI/PurR family transcriptional regulator